jgi:CubicO group peptidase (beta-lactamase class C family)
MTHRAGIPSLVDVDDPLTALLDRDAVVERLCDTRPTLAPGRRLAYHAVTGGFILDAVARAASGRPVDELLARDFAAPLGCRHLGFGLAPEHRHLAAQNAFTGWPVPFPISRVFRRAFGLTVPDAVDASNDPRFMDAVVPAGNAFATADDLCRFFEMLLDDGRAPGGAQILAPRTVRRARVESAWFELDLTLGIPVRYGQGLMLGSRRLSMFGPRTEKAFGHYGFVTIIGWADPARDLSGALLTSGKAVIANVFPSLWRTLNAISSRVPMSGRAHRAVA